MLQLGRGSGGRFSVSSWLRYTSVPAMPVTPGSPGSASVLVACEQLCYHVLSLSGVTSQDASAVPQSQGTR